jgi:hypothetical protein
MVVRSVFWLHHLVMRGIRLYLCFVVLGGLQSMQWRVAVQ